jgi:hypothetical protein
MTHSGVHLQITSEDRPSIPHWLGEVALVAQVLTASGVLKSIEEQVRFARARFGTYELIDFVAVLIGYAVSAEPTLQAFYERVEPFASAFMALFGRENLPHRCTLSRYLAALEQPVVEALRAQFLHDLILRTTQTFPPGGLWDRQGQHWLVVDIDGTKKAARQRALPKLADLPEAHRRFDRVCAPGYLGRKRGEVARTRTTVLQAHSHHWLGTFGGPGNGDYRAELARACEAIISYAGWLCMPLSRFLVRLDGLYGTTAVLRPLLLAGLGAIVRWKDYGLLDLPCVAARLKEPPDTQTTHPESGTQRSLFDCPAVTIDPSIPPVRVIIATHPTTSTAKPPIGILRDGIVYELFLTTAAEVAFTCPDVLDLYLHRGSFETVLADEDEEQETDRWCSRTTWGQECWQIMNQWIWNLRLSFGQHIAPSTLCLTAFAPAAEPATLASKKPVTASAPLTSSEPVAASTSLANNEPIATSTALASNEPSAASTALVSSEPVTASVPLASNEPVQYEPPRWAHRSWTSGFAGSDFVLQPDGSLRCPAGHPLLMHERRPERNGSIRVVYGARIVHCRPCPLRGLCQESPTTKKPRQVSAVLWPVQSQPPDHPPFAESPPPEPFAIHPVLWGDWPRSRLRRTFLRTLHTQTVELTLRSLPPEEIRPAPSHEVQTRAARAHWRLSWQQRLARNARPAFSSVLEIKIYGLPAA